MGLNPEAMERLKLTQEGMAQFEQFHSPKQLEGGRIVCSECEIDFPCQRMATMLVVQGLAQAMTMLPTGNIAGVLARFGGGAKS
jgi:hypothetical protein